MEYWEITCEEFYKDEIDKEKQEILNEITNEQTTERKVA